MQTRSSSRRVTRQSARLSSAAGELFLRNHGRNVDLKMAVVAGSKRPAASQLEEPKPKRRKTLPNTVSSASRSGVVISISSISVVSKPADEGSVRKEQRDELAKLRKELKQRDAEIELLTTSAETSKQEAEASERKQALDLLEEHFTCALSVHPPDSTTTTS